MSQSTTCKFSGGTSTQTIATVTYTGTNENAVMTGYTVTGGDAKYPSSTDDMILNIMVVNGNLSSAIAYLKGSLEQVFACATGGGAGGNNFQWNDTNNNPLSSDNCDLTCG